MKAQIIIDPAWGNTKTKENLYTSVYILRFKAIKRFSRNCYSRKIIKKDETGLYLYAGKNSIISKCPKSQKKLISLLLCDDKYISFHVFVRHK